MNKPWNEENPAETISGLSGAAVDEALAGLAREHRAIAAPAGLESRLREAASSQSETNAVRRAAQPDASPRRTHRWAWTLAISAAAMLLIGLALWTAQRRVPAAPHTQLAVQDKSVHSVADAPLETAQQPRRAVAKLTKNRKSVTRSTGSATPPQNEAESATLGGFMPLPGSEGLPDPYDATVVRVEMAKGQLEQYGFHVPPAVEAERVRAEFFVGEDGLPRAIRLVR